MGILCAALHRILRRARSVNINAQPPGRRLHRRPRHPHSSTSVNNILLPAVSAAIDSERGTCTAGVFYVVMATCCLATYCSAMEEGQPPSLHHPNVTMLQHSQSDGDVIAFTTSVGYQYSYTESNAQGIVSDDTMEGITIVASAIVGPTHSRVDTTLLHTSNADLADDDDESMTSLYDFSYVSGRLRIPRDRRIAMISLAPSYKDVMLTSRLGFRAKSSPFSSFSMLAPTNLTSRKSRGSASSSSSAGGRTVSGYPCRLSPSSLSSSLFKQQQCLFLSDTAINYTCGLSERQRRIRGSSLALRFCSHVPLEHAVMSLTFTNSTTCRSVLTELERRDLLAHHRFVRFERALSKFDCEDSSWGQWPCHQCLVSHYFCAILTSELGLANFS
jgi:hypothetical protein